MFISSTRRCRFALVAVPLMFAIVVLASVSAARANITYNIVDYPGNVNNDSPNLGTNVLSGTIVTDGVLGTITSSDIVGGSWTLSNSTAGISLTTPIIPEQSSSTGNGNLFANNNTLVATSDSLFLPQGGFFAISKGDSFYSTNPVLNYENAVGGYEDAFDAWTPYNNDATNQHYLYFANGSYSDYGFYSGAGSILSTSWTIANGGTPTPEPTSLTLLISALLGLVGSVYLRRRRATA